MNFARLTASILVHAVLLVGCASQARELRATQGAYEVEVLVDGVPAPTFFHRGETYVLGQLGERYIIRVHNRSSRRVEAVVSVDGRDVIDGKPANYQAKRGYLVMPYSSADIDGWRISHQEAAAFRFSKVADAYAARMGSARDVGVIGVAIFPERWVPRAPPLPAAVVPGEYWERRSAEKDDAPASPGYGAAAPRSSASSTDGSLAANKSARHRSGLGTEYGEAVSSSITEVPFVRANATVPDLVLGARYNDRQGLYALGILVDQRPGWSENELRQTANPFPVADRFARPPPGWQR